MNQQTEKKILSNLMNWINIEKQCILNYKKGIENWKQKKTNESKYHVQLLTNHIKESQETINDYIEITKKIKT